MVTNEGKNSSEVVGLRNIFYDSKVVMLSCNIDVSD